MNVQNCKTLIESEGHVKGTPNNPKGKETKLEELEIVVRPYDGGPLDSDGRQTLIVLKESTPIVEKK